MSRAKNRAKTTQRSVLPTFRVDPNDESAIPPIDREWLLTNGAGGYAMGTVVGCNTRRYHGLLVAAARPPVERIVTVGAIHETLSLGGEKVELANHEFAGQEGPVFHPRGWHHLAAFEKDTEVRWTYRVGPLQVVKTLRLVWKRQAAAVTYRLSARGGEGGEAGGAMPERVTLELMPMLAMRDFHGLRRSYETPFTHDREDSRSLRVRVGSSPGDGPTLHVASDRGRWEDGPDWWHDFFYRRDADRRQDAVEARYIPGRFEVACDPAAPTSVTVAFGLEPVDGALLPGRDGGASRSDEPRRAHLEALARRATASLEPEHRRDGAALAVASDDFVVGRTIDGEPSTTIIAGYPWFSDWGRDTMIALPGCLMATGRLDEARSTLMTFAAHIADGLIPNRFDDYGGDPHYNTVDASLWFVQAALAYMNATDDLEAWDGGLCDACMKIVDAYAAGTRYGIAMDRDGLITAGSPETQLTWMDAARDGVVFTPRWGKAVEINALWHHALRGLADHADSARCDEYDKLAQRARKSFAKVFWDEQRGYLVDHVNAHGVDRSLRPNQALAVSLPGGLLDKDRGKRVMTALRDRLLTPMGLRTLPPDDPAYHGRYEGSMFQLDEAYHQGTVWAWLIGPFIEGWLRAHDFSPESRAQAQQDIAPLLTQLGNHSLGQLHEVFDADPHHHPRGCIAQAWSVAELLRAQQLIDA